MFALANGFSGRFISRYWVSLIGFDLCPFMEIVWHLSTQVNIGDLFYIHIYTAFRTDTVCFIWHIFPIQGNRRIDTCVLDQNTFVHNLILHSHLYCIYNRHRLFHMTYLSNTGKQTNKYVCSGPEDFRDMCTASKTVVRLHWPTVWLGDLFPATEWA